MTGDYISKTYQIEDIDKSSVEEGQFVSAYAVLENIKKVHALRGTYFLDELSTLGVDERFIIHRMSSEGEVLKSWVVCKADSDYSFADSFTTRYINSI